MNTQSTAGIKLIYKLLRILLVLIAALYVTVCALLYTFQRDILYLPTQLSPAAEPFIERLVVDGAVLALSVQNRPGPDAILYFGGNAEDVSERLNNFPAYFPNHAIYLQHYRGYGGSTGEPTEVAMHADAQAVYDWVKTRHQNIVVIGRSLGSGVAIRLAAQNPVSHLILLTPYDSILNVARGRYPFAPVGLLLADKFESDLFAPAIDVPVLVLQAEEDRVVPHPRADALLEKFAPGIAKRVTIADTNHNSIWTKADSYNEIANFISSDN